MKNVICNLILEFFPQFKLEATVQCTLYTLQYGRRKIQLHRIVLIRFTFPFFILNILNKYFVKVFYSKWLTIEKETSSKDMLSKCIVLEKYQIYIFPHLSKRKCRTRKNKKIIIKNCKVHC
jgi:hypothetical protein